MRASFCVLLLTFVLTACSGAGSAPTPTPTLSATPTAVPPAETSTPLVVRPAATPTEAPRCPDPYPGGTPVQPAAGEPIRIQPTGSPPAVARYQPLPLQPDEELLRVIFQNLGDERRHFSVFVKDLASGRGVELRADRPFYAASLFKVWVLLEAFHQREHGLLEFDEQYIVSDYYTQEFRLNPGELEWCSTTTVESALRSMIQISDNVAANMMLDRVGSANVNASLANLGLTRTGFHPDLDLPATAGETALLLEAIARGAAVSPQASLEMMSYLLGQRVADRLPALLPAGTSVAHKTGNWSTATHDAGIVFSPGATYVIVVLTDYGYGDDAASRIAQLSLAVHDYYNAGATAAP